MSENLPSNQTEAYQFKLRHLVPPLVGLAGFLFDFLIFFFVKNHVLMPFSFTQYEPINRNLTQQLYVLPISFLVLGGMYEFDRDNFKLFFRKGEIFAEAKPLNLLGITKEDTWRKIGPILAVIFIVATVIYMSMAVIMMGGRITSHFFTLFPLALIFSISNAWNEEIFTRFTVVSGLHGKMRPKHIYWISALIFGIPHYFGTPGGVIGVIMASSLGWFLAKSVGDTKGMFWAWFIHFLLDVVLFSGLLMILP